MAESYPQETIGTTLLSTSSGGEYRRVYMRTRPAGIELGEFTKGPLTQEYYGAPTHHHSVQLQGDALAGYIKSYFKNKDIFLADFMDVLDSQHITYGYVNSMQGEYVTYRPRNRKPSA